ncbi:lysylphosphatidylglycerol synthase transmembrane domain-containing protein [Sphingobium sp.]|uniref:lysylphosphatidylglycerol synthase transmembrane domain-containing protein n=1 Tax=Sphingobium sp. TaxID=1912891 RepID=UPI0028BE561A|nr:lysylphosphatidylglycerol synthase transmembrane domain-containing protein [Sphingobium sp.]
MLRTVVQCGIGIFLLALFLRQIDLTSTRSAIGRATIAPLIASLMAYALDFLLRSVRFWMLLKAVSGRQLPLRSVPGPFIASFGISDLLPLRAGDLFRLAWFQRKRGLTTGSVIGAMIIERFYDLSSLLLVAAMLLGWHLGSISSIFILCGGILAMILLPMALSHISPDARRTASFLPARPWMTRIATGWQDMRNAFRILGSFRRVAKLGAISLICWTLEASLFLGVWISLGETVERWPAPMAAFTASTLGTLVPGLPGHFGTFELFGFEAFTLSGVTHAKASAVLLLAHLLLWAPTALFAIIWLFFVQPGGQSRKAAKQTDGMLPHG